MANKLPEIVLAGNAPQEQCKMLNAILSEEELSDICNITLYGADGQPETEALKDSIDDYADGQIQGIVCLPFNTPHINILKEYLGDETETMFNLFVNSRMKMASVLGDVESTDAEKSITLQAIVTRATQVANVLKRDFMIQNPRIAIVTMNTNTDNQEQEDKQDITVTAIEELVKVGIQAFGPIDAANFFTPEVYQEYDALIEIFDKQCMDVFQDITNSPTLTLIAGVKAPIATVSYENILQAIFLVIDVERNRRIYDAPFANPLPKLYKERREDGDKTRFAVKKKGFNPAEHRRENINYTTIVKPKE